MIKWTVKAIPFEHHLEISKIAAKCILRSTSSEQKKQFEDLGKKYKLENCVGAVGNEEMFVPIMDSDIPADISEVIAGCYAGAHNLYCEQKGL